MLAPSRFLLVLMWLTPTLAIAQNLANEAAEIAEYEAALAAELDVDVAAEADEVAEVVQLADEVAEVVELAEDVEVGVAIAGEVVNVVQAMRADDAVAEAAEAPPQPAANAEADKDQAVISLINGNTIVGQLRTSESPDVIQWQGKHFTEPFAVLSDAIKSIKFPTAEKLIPQQGQFAFESVSGDLMSGQLTSWTAEGIEIDSPLFGKVMMRPESLRRLYRIEQNPTLVFASLSGLQDWNTTGWETTGWQEDGAHVWTDKPDVTINGDLGVPDKAIIEFQISWTDKPNFVFAVAVDADAKKDDRKDGWRFETIDETLAVLREHRSIADVAMVASVKARKSVRLLAYLDQTIGQMQVYQPDGTLLAKISPPTEFLEKIEEQKLKAGRGIRFVNRGKDVRLERLRISRWSGKLPTKGAGGVVDIAMADGTIVAGDSVRLDTEAEQLIVSSDGDDTNVSLADVVALKIDGQRSEEASFETSLFLHDGARVSGKVESISPTHWKMASSEFLTTLQVPRDMARTFIVMKRDPVPPGKKVGRSGRLELGSHKLTGHLVPAIEQEAAGVSSLRWQPFGCLNSSSLTLNADGRIVYRDPPKVTVNRATQQTAQRALQLQRVRLQQQKRGLNFGQLFLQKADSRPAAKRVGPDAHKLHVRSGDVIPCLIDSINEEGVQITTAVADDAFIPHNKIKAIELVANATPPNLKEAKKYRLLTLPRLQKSSPPTHLLCSSNGDFLRCRLLEVNDQFVRVELQLEEIEIPRSRISQIIWFHPEELLAEEKAAKEDEPPAIVSPFAGLAQILKRDGKRVTFDPEQVDATKISGTSDVLGPCHFELSDVDQVIFGEGIRDAVAVLPYNQWQLRGAVEPLMAQDSPDGAAEVGSESALIGQDAPEIKLDMLDGGKFLLSQCKGQIVVLDFWATWCAPCMQTMPLVEKAMADYDPNQVRLVSVNLEESADHVKSVLERHDMHVAVALDIDGVAAARYEARAIPQMVIVAPDGKIARLYVGGGSKTVEQMKAAIDLLLE